METRNNFNEEISNKIEASKLKIIISRVFDVAILIAGLIFILIFYAHLSEDNHIKTTNPILIVLFFFVVYRLIPLFLTGATIGMHLCKIVLLNSDEKPMSIKESALAAIFILYKGVDYYDK